MVRLGGSEGGSRVYEGGRAGPSLGVGLRGPVPRRAGSSANLTGSCRAGRSLARRGTDVGRGRRGLTRGRGRKGNVPDPDLCTSRVAHYRGLIERGCSSGWYARPRRVACCFFGALGGSVVRANKASVPVSGGPVPG